MKKHRTRRWLALLLTAGMLVGLVPADGTQAVHAAGEFDADADLLAHYPLETDVKDVSGNDKDASITDGASGVDFSGDALNLAGGARSTGNYVTLPDGLFDGQDTVTVSLWISNHGNQTNTAAFFFGSAPEGTKVDPANYFLLNPCSPSGHYKAVFTNSLNAGQPWTTEAGINGTVSTAGFMDQWKLYTVVIDGSAKTLTGYLDGEDLGTVNLSRTVSDFGTGLKAHIGASQYLNDPLFAGSFRDLRIYNKALTDAEVAELFEMGTERNKLLEDKAALSLGDLSAVIGNLTLPAQGANGSAITWESTNESAVDAEGKVTITDTEQTAELTATLTLGDSSVTKTFEVTVAAKSDLEQVVKDRVRVPYTVTDSLPTEFEGGITVRWNNTDGLIAEDGTVSAPDKSTVTTVTALITYGGETFEKELTVLVMEKGAEYVMSYTRSNVSAALGQSMHLALSSDGETYEALHNNTGVLFAKADLDEWNAGTTRTLSTPYLFRMGDGKIGVIAVRDDGKVLFLTTENLMDFSEESFLDLHAEGAVKNPQCEYNGKEYVITWEDGSGQIYQNTTSDFETISQPSVGGARAESAPAADIENAVPCNVIPVTKEEADGLRIKLGSLENTGVEEKTYTFEVNAGETLTAEDTKDAVITAEYNDGTTDDIPITWDFSDVDFYNEGTYTITGQAKLTEYPVLNGRADPNIYKYNGKYYFIATGETQNQSQMCIREADTPLGLFSAADHELFPNTRTPNWAPELHEIGGKLYILYAKGGSWDQVQSQLMELKEGGDPTVRADWEDPKPVTRKDGSALYDKGITLDMTYFQVGDTHYLCWAQRQITGGNGTSDLWIATIDPSNPYQLTSDPVCILRNQYGWDRVDTTVDEGPFVIQNDGKIYMTFSGAATGNLYVVGLLTADEDADLLDAASWKETGYPILSSESVPGELGPGHSCFSTDEDGRDIFVYHMRPNGGTRSATVRRVHWAPDGSPVLDMTIDQELKEEYRTVTGTVKVNGSVDFDDEDGLIVRYRLENDAKDSSGNGYDAQVKGDASFDKESLVLSGGAKSNQNYVQLPTGIFDGENELTISMWIKNNNTKINTAAFSINSQSKIGTSPEYYFLLNPSNPDGYYKAVLTDPPDGSTANPWTQEVGVNNSNNNSVVTSDRMNEWMYYTITIDEDTITGYLDGKLVGSDEINNQTISDFGKELTAYIGASAYPDDTFAGSFRDVRVYGKCMDEAQAGQLYRKALEIQNVKEVKTGITLQDGKTVYSDLELIQSTDECEVVWTSSDENVIRTDGTVLYGDEKQTVTLTAVITCGSYSEECSYDIIVPSADEAKAGVYRTQLLIPRYVSEDLQTEVDGQPITWTCSVEGLVAEDGTVTHPEEDTKAVLTASVGDVIVEREVTVMSGGGQIISYVIKGGNLYENTGDLLAAEDSRRSDALFLALKKDGDDSYIELNKGKAVAYVKWSGDQASSPDNQMGSPVLFRKADGSLAAAASGNNNRNGIYVWDTDEDMLFTSERFLVLAEEGTKVQNPSVVYDEMAETYKVFWQDGEGTSYVSLMDNLNRGTVPTETEECTYVKAEVPGVIPDNAVASQTSVFEASESEFKKLNRKYGTIFNTNVTDVEIEAKTGEEITLPDTVTAVYSDGSTKKLGVIWDEDALNQIDPDKEGTYEITGEVQQDAYAYPFIEERADPHIFYNEDDGHYYSTGSYYEENMTAPNCAQSYRKLDIRRAETIEGLKTAEEHYILESKVGDRWGGFFWAPEFHKINGTWYCLVGAHDFGNAGIQENTNWNNANWCSYSILIPYEGTDEQMQAGGMLDAEQWGEPIILENSPSFDVSYYEDENGQGYYIMPQNAQISIVKAKGGEGVVPQPTGERVVIKSGEWPWEYGVYEGSISASNPEGTDQLVVEGPYLFEYGDKVYISYSAATVDKYYTLGLMMADKGSDLMDPDSWINIPYPLLSSYDTYEGEIGGGAHVGGGHNSIVLDEYGNLALVYHARPYPDPHAGQSGAGGLFDPCRHTVVKSIHVAADGALIFNMTAEEELDPNFRTVTAVVKIEDDAQTVLEDLVIAKGPDKTTYIQGEELDPAGLKVEAHYSDGTVVELKEGEGGYSVSGYDPQKLGEQSVMVSFGGITKFFQVTVEEKEEPQPEPELTGIVIVSGPDKTTYVQGEELDLTGLEVHAQYSDGREVVLSESEDGYTVAGYDPQKTGTQTITVTYLDYMASFTVEVEQTEEPGGPDQPGDTEDPDDTQKPGDTEDPGDTQKPGDAEKPDDTQKPDDSQNGGQLKPGQDDTQTAVQTGDYTNIMLPVMLIVLSGLCAGTVIYRKRRM